MNYCAINTDWEDYIVGESLSEIINYIFHWEINEERKLVVKAKYFLKDVCYSYSEEWSQEEIQKDVVSFLVTKLNDYGWMLFKNTNVWQ